MSSIFHPLLRILQYIFVNKIITRAPVLIRTRADAAPSVNISQYRSPSSLSPEPFPQRSAIDYGPHVEFQCDACPRIPKISHLISAIAARILVGVHLKTTPRCWFGGCGDGGTASVEGTVTRSSDQDNRNPSVV